MKFKTPKSMKGMTEREYLKSVFYRNRKEIIAVFGKDKPLQKFINNVQAQKIVGGGLSTKQALNKLANTESFTPEGERLKTNLQEGLKSHDKLKEFKNLIRDEKGRFQKFDEKKLVWDRDLNMYVYDNRITIDVKNSPHDIVIGVINND